MDDEGLDEISEIDVFATLCCHSEEHAMREKKQHILVLTYWPFKEALIQSYTLPYLRRIRNVCGKDTIITLVTLERTVSSPEFISEEIHHLPIQSDLFNFKKVWKWFFIIRTLAAFSKKNSVTHLHAWCMPGAVMAWRVSKLTGLQFIIDSYEPHAEAMVENGTWKRSSFRYKFLFYLEKKVSREAYKLIAISPFMQEYAKAKYGIERHMEIKPACTELDLFKPEHEKKNDTITCVYAGKLGGIYFEDEVFHFVRECAEHWGSKFRFLLLGNYTDSYITDRCKATGCPQSVIEHTFVPHSEIPSWIAKATFGLTPVKPVPTKKCCSPIKDGEYWASGLPVVITKNISIDSDLIKENQCGAVLEDMSPDSIKNALRTLDALFVENQSLRAERCRKLAENYRNYSIAENIYRGIYS